MGSILHLLILLLLILLIVALLHFSELQHSGIIFWSCCCEIDPYRAYSIGIRNAMDSDSKLCSGIIVLMNIRFLYSSDDILFN